MKMLKSLSLGDNFVEEIPSELGLCKELHTLYLHHNSFTTLPCSMASEPWIWESGFEWKAVGELARACSRVVQASSSFLSFFLEPPKQVHHAAPAASDQRIRVAAHHHEAERFMQGEEGQGLCFESKRAA